MPSHDTRMVQEPDQEPEEQAPVGHGGDLQTGQVLHNRYRVQDILGVGGMGAVYLARDLNFAEVTRLCAVKEMSNFAANVEMRETLFRNFQREANILATLNHPAIPEIYDYFNDEERVYLVLEYINGKNLETILYSTDKYLPVEQVREWAIEICDVLSYLHGHDPEPIVFRDMKPANVMIDQFRKVRLIDFGIAKTFAGDQRHTMIGTEGYSPPEQYRGEASPQGDIYALGATLHHLLSRRDPRLEPPFTFESRLIGEINSNVPPQFVAIVERALAYERTERYGTIEEMKAALEDLGGDRQVVVPTAGAGAVQVAAASSAVPTAAVGFSPGSGEVLPIWTFQVEDEIRSKPVIEKDIVYVGSYDNNLWAIDAKKGDFIWKYATEGGIGASPALQPPYVFVGSVDRSLYAIDSRKGTIQWTYQTNGKIFSSPRALLGHIFFGADDSILYAVKTTNGQLAWRFESQGPIRSTPAISTEHEMIYFGCENGDFYGLDLRGDMKWRFKARRAIISSPVVHEGMVYFGSNDSTLYALDARSGFTNWRFRARKPVVSSPAFADGTLYFGSADQNLYALDGVSGKELWKFETEGQIASSPLVYENIVYFGSDDSYVYALNASTGDIMWKFKTEGPVSSSPVASDGIVYVGSTDHRLYALKA